MAGPWLYVISERAGMHWELENKKPPVSVSIASYEKLLKAGELTQDKWWGISQNWKNVRSNDEVFLYTGDDDLGIIGYGTILRIVADLTYEYKSEKQEGFIRASD